MMKNKHISKITMLTCLMLGGIVNAQEFYTCVPKKSWWSDTIKESVKTGIIEEKKENWKLVDIFHPCKNSNNSVELSSGKYRLSFKKTPLSTIIGLGTIGDMLQNSKIEKDFNVFNFDKLYLNCNKESSYYKIIIGLEKSNMNKEIIDTTVKDGKLFIIVAKLYKYE